MAGYTLYDTAADALLAFFTSPYLGKSVSFWYAWRSQAAYMSKKSETAADFVSARVILSVQLQNLYILYWLVSAFGNRLIFSEMQFHRYTMQADYFVQLLM